MAPCSHHGQQQAGQVTASSTPHRTATRRRRRRRPCFCIAARCYYCSSSRATILRRLLVFRMRSACACWRARQHPQKPMPRRVGIFRFPQRVCVYIHARVSRKKESTITRRHTAFSACCRRPLRGQRLRMWKSSSVRVRRVYIHTAHSKTAHGAQRRRAAERCGACCVLTCYMGACYYGVAIPTTCMYAMTMVLPLLHVLP